MNFREHIEHQQKEHPEPKRKYPDYTVGDLIRAVLSIHEEKEAKLFRDGYFESLREAGKTDAEANRLVRSNIGWCMGEGMSQKDIEMWNRVGASHPVFGSMLSSGPTAEAAFNAGVKRGMKMAKRGMTKVL